MQLASSWVANRLTYSLEEQFTLKLNLLSLPPYPHAESQHIWCGRSVFRPQGSELAKRGSKPGSNGIILGSQK